MANYLARIAAVGARTAPTIRPAATPYPPLFRPLPVPRPHIAAASVAEESVVPPEAARPSAQAPQMRENDLPPSARVRAPRIAPERQPEAPVGAIAPAARVVAPVAERVPVANLPGDGAAPAEPAAHPNIAPPPGAPLVTPPDLAVAVPTLRRDLVSPGRPAEAGGRQRGNAGSRIAIGTIDVRVVNTPVAAAANTPSPPPASGPDAPMLVRFRLRP
jgi:hypothetical protein